MNHFELFGLAEGFELDTRQLADTYRQLQTLINTVVWTPVHATAFKFKTSVVALPALLSEDEG